MQEERILSVESALEADVRAFDALTTQLGWVGRRRLEQELDAFGLTGPQFMALRCIQEHGGSKGGAEESGCSMSALAEASHQVSATMTGIVDRLTERGLVRRERHPSDRRTLCVVLTPAGKDLLARVNAHKQESIRAFLAELPGEDRVLLMALIQRYLEKMVAGLRAAE